MSSTSRGFPRWTEYGLVHVMGDWNEWVDEQDDDMRNEQAQPWIKGVKGVMQVMLKMAEMNG